ncbi:MAG TPA: primosomal protein N' [Armatimonadota bacterium]|nr:primosomal protein N' [Armatimonadota bacterium]
MADAVLVLGSATPSVESYYLASTGEYRLVEMPERILGRALPKSTVVDLRTNGDKAKVDIFSEALMDSLADRLRRGEQSILFLNRRGFASFILCRECGYTAQCPHCSVALTLHVSDRSLRCHHCNYRRPAPTVCPNCNGTRIYPFGLGTERLEAEVHTRFPEARVLRMDRDTTSTKNAHSRLYRAFRQGEADILIGTQMVAKGLDFPGVTLVGVIAADMGLNVPDFRAAERTFQLLTQVAGRAGRGEQPGEVLLQTFNPDHYAITTARDQDYAGFYAQEIDFRRELGYPPFGVLVNLISTDTDATVAETRARRAVAAVAHVVKREKREKWNVEVLGPSPAPLARLKSRFRWHAIVRGAEEAQVHTAVRAGVEALPIADRDALTVDVDPYGMA